jgi:hypothetical protein
MLSLPILAHEITQNTTKIIERKMFHNFNYYEQSKYLTLCNISFALSTSCSFVLCLRAISIIMLAFYYLI